MVQNRKDSFASGSFRILRILRLARSARGLRIVRLLRFIRPLRLLVFSIAVTLKSLIWSVILLFIIIYLFSILFADANLAHFTSGGHTPPTILTDHDLQTHFGGVQISMHTLFRAICGGLEWRHAANSLDSSIGWGFLDFEQHIFTNKWSREPKFEASNPTFWRPFQFWDLEWTMLC